MRDRLRRALTAVGVVIAATVATSTIGAGQANALTGWTPYTVIVQARATVGSVTATAQIRRSPELNKYYAKVTCDNTNIPATTVRVNNGAVWSSNVSREIGFVPYTPWGETAVSYSSWFTAFNDYLQVYGICDYYYNGHYGRVETNWSARVWVGYWTG